MCKDPYKGLKVPRSLSISAKDESLKSVAKRPLTLKGNHPFLGQPVPLSFAKTKYLFEVEYVYIFYRGIDIRQQQALWI